MIKVGDRVRPKPEWRNTPNKIPSGVVVCVERWGRGVVVYVGSSPRAFADFVFEPATEED
jgi:hypothetical protein